MSGRAIYKARSPAEIGWLFAKAYGAEIDFSNQIEGLKRIAAYMTEGKWALAKIATVQLRFPELPDGRSMKALLAAEAYLAKCQCKTPQFERKASSNKRDVSDEPRVPAGQSGGGQWTTDAGSPANLSDPLLIPAQAITAPIPAPFELPMPPTGISPPLPLEIPGGIREPTPVNPYPDKPECGEEWAHAMAFCTDQRKNGKLKGGYGGFGKDFASCLRGMVSEACGGNPTA